MIVERARADDLPAVLSLLEACDLPLDGASGAFTLGVVARDAGGLLGCAALEQYGTDGVLRSVAVDAHHRNAGIGRALVAAAEELARTAGVQDVYLLTETAARWFGGLGYERIDRSGVPAAVGASVEFAGACPVEAVAFRRRLEGSPG